jgi:hypothetical protein
MPDPSLRAGLEHLIEQWQACSAKAGSLVLQYSQGGDDAGNAHAFLKEQRIWNTCANRVADLLRAQPPDWATTDAPGVCGRGHTERQPKCPACHDMRIEAHGRAQPPPAPDPLPKYDPDWSEDCVTCSAVTWCEHFHCCLAAQVPQVAAPPAVEGTRPPDSGVD